MPVPLRTNLQKAEAKYNVTTDFPSLGLHSAAASGNVGLVEYALDHGQPVNSVLDGVLPLHAACAGGNLQVVALLIDHGADVNAPRLPRKYSSEKGRDASAPIVGTSGSTPLHFAAANGNTEVVSLLLLRGAHADRADKHGITPEMLAYQNGWVECAKVLRDWILNKDRDLRDREGWDVRAGLPPQDAHDNISPRRRLHVKQSIDTALNMLTTSRTGPPGIAATPPASPLRPFGEYTFHPTDSTSSIDPTTRRPSLPHILSPAEPVKIRKSTSSTPSTTLKQRRPRSAGTHAERVDKRPSETVYPVYGRGGSGRKVHSKVSLLNIFKKSQAGESADLANNASDLGPRNSPRSASKLLHGSTVTLPLPMSSNPSGNASTPSLPDYNGLPATAPSRSGFLHRGSDASVKPGRVTPQVQTSNIAPIPRKASGNLQSPSRNGPSAIELHLALAHSQRAKIGPVSNVDAPTSLSDDGDIKSSSPLSKIKPLLLHNRNRSLSSSSSPFDNSPHRAEDHAASIASPNDSIDGKQNPNPSPSSRPGILRAHNRNPSNGQGSPLNVRTLRFDSSSSMPGIERKAKESPRPASRPLQPSSSSNSLTQLAIQTNPDIRDTESINGSVKVEFATDDDHDDPEESYGKPIVSLPSAVPSVLLQRQRGLSFDSISSLSPILTNDNNDLTKRSDFPFSINQPPVTSADDFIEESPPALLNVPVSSDTRGRGDSLSSNSTSESNMRTISSSGTSASGTSATVSTPALVNTLNLPRSDKLLDRKLPSVSMDDDVLEPPPPMSVLAAGGHTRRSHTPLDIDLSLISSHAQAEALVERARQGVLEVASSSAGDLSPVSGSTGRTPLSARLAAYGESLALERKLREQKEVENARHDYERSQEQLPILSPSSLFPPSPASIPRQKSREGVERQLSLEHRSPSRPRKPRNDPRRPATSEGVSNRHPDTFFKERAISHHTWRSASASNQPSSALHETPDTPIASRTIKEHETTQPPLVIDPPTPMQSNRTPIGVPSDGPLSRISSTDDQEMPEDSTLNIPRTGTSAAFNPKKSSKKLARMGIPVAEQAAAANRATPPTPPTSKRFGTIKSLMQTFRGKA